MKMLLLPFLAVLFFFGYALSTVGQPKQRKDIKRKPKQPTENPTPTIEIGVLAPPQEQPLIINQTKREA